MAGRATAALPGSSGSWPAIVSSISALSATVRVIGPTWSSVKRQREDAAARHQAVGRLQPDDAAAARGIAHAAAGVGAERQREQAGGHARARAGRRAAGMMVGVPRVARRRPRQVEARPADGEFVRRQLAEHDRAGAAQLRARRPRRRGDVVHQDLRMAGRRQAGDVDDVLDADRHAVQRPAQAAGDLGLGGLGRRHRRLGVEPDEDVEPRVERARCARAAPSSARPARAPWRRSPGPPRPRVSQCRSPTGLDAAHSPSPARIGGHGSARGSVGA